MALYWEEQRTTESSKSTGTKLLAAIICVLILLSSGLVVIFQMLPSGGLVTPNQGVRIAVIDSGLDQDYTTSNRVAAAMSFISPQYGYSVTDSSTSDSNPDDGAGNNVRHGTMVARAITQNSDNSLLVIAKVIDATGTATASGLIAAIYWAIEQNCSVINLSLGSTPTFGDPLKDMVDYAFSEGVIVVTAAGNEGDGGIPGTSLSSPSVYPNTISVGALDENGNPASYSSQGPTVDRYMKPDIAAKGYVETSTAIYYGTSFASPVIAAYAAELIHYCVTNDLDYTVGSITAALLEGATPLPYPEYRVGSGRANLANSINLLSTASTENNIPQITHVDVSELPLDFETLFQGDNYTFSIEIITSSLTEFDVTVTGIDAEIVDLPSMIEVNQAALIPVKLVIPNDPSTITGTISFSSEDTSDQISINIDPRVAIAKIAFDTTHTTWTIDSAYGQFKNLYLQLVDNDISVTEIQDRTFLTSDYLSNFDAVFVLDPCVWDINETDYENPSLFSTTFTAEEISAYEGYFHAGGGIFVSTLSNDSLDVSSLNEFLQWTGASIGAASIPAAGSYVSISNIQAHPITVGVSSFDYNGGNVLTNVSYTNLASISGHTVLAAYQGAGGGRLVITGTNYFIDNWGISGLYSSDDNSVLALRIGLWLSGHL